MLVLHCHVSFSLMTHGWTDALNISRSVVNQGTAILNEDFHLVNKLARMLFFAFLFFIQSKQHQGNFWQHT
jgi:hypothetical protein